MFVDSHCHLYSEYFDNLDIVKRNALNAGITKVINNGCDRRSNEEVLKLINTNEYMYGAIGIHPENVNNYTLDDLKFIENNLNNKKIIAIGEIGLDYYYDSSNQNAQIILFEKQLSLAEKYHLPVVIHSRNATMDMLNILKKYKLKGVIHSFVGTMDEAQEFIKLGYFLGINGIITFKNSDLKNVIQNIPMEKIILETDAPYLAPHPYRGKKNEPMYIKVIAEYVANIKSISMHQLADITNKNIKELFNI